MSPQQQQAIPRGMAMAKKSGLEFLCRPACEYKSSWIPAKGEAPGGILR
jgi:hypothetical protein